MAYFKICSSWRPIWALVVAVLCRTEDCYEGDDRAEKGDVLICPSVQREKNDEGKKRQLMSVLSINVAKCASISTAITTTRN